jgi:GrpB-like predicted nucleotidyltransferase (UPF0157 family)
MPGSPIGPYPRPAPPPTCDDYDPRVVEVAQRVIALVREQLTAVSIEHIGSTAVPGCAGKGYVDLMAVYHDPDELAAIKAVLERLGFQRQRGRTPWPEDRPMRLGALAHDGATFLLHFHVIFADSPEVATQRAFRDGLRADPALVSAYVANKRAVIASGITDGIDYSQAKGDFIESAMDQIRAAVPE